MTNIYNWYKTARKNDPEFRKTAKEIADRVIAYILSTENKWGKGIPEKFINGDQYLNFSEIAGSPLFITFSYQIANRKSLAEVTGNKINIRLPSKTKSSAIYYSSDQDGKRIRINETVARFLSKPEHYNTLVHEITHVLDSRRTKGMVNKNYPYENKGSAEYYAHPAEYNAFLQAFLIQLEKFNLDVGFEEVKHLMEKELWFNKMPPKLKRKALNRAYLWVENKNTKENQSVESL